MKTIEAFKGFEELSVKETAVITGGFNISYWVGLLQAAIAQSAPSK